MLKCFVMKSQEIHICDTTRDLDSYMDQNDIHNFYSNYLNNILNEVSFEVSTLVSEFLTKDVYVLPQSDVCFYLCYNSDEGLVDDFGAILGDITGELLYNNLFRTSDYMIFADCVSI